ncbi:MAG: hypothetical protein BWY57_02743 [Betaproteobacteria bacterium ADurb.Bin341]|nr:MAG: hypothetical protein BWY57_02743 [Betaproteobacteria bacterium ADurb.Bin341]
MGVPVSRIIAILGAFGTELVEKHGARMVLLHVFLDRPIKQVVLPALRGHAHEVKQAAIRRIGLRGRPVAGSFPVLRIQRAVIAVQGILLEAGLPVRNLHRGGHHSGARGRTRRPARIPSLPVDIEGHAAPLAADLIEHLRELAFGAHERVRKREPVAPVFAGRHTGDHLTAEAYEVQPQALRQTGHLRDVLIETA